VKLHEDTLRQLGNKPHYFRKQSKSSTKDIESIPRIRITGNTKIS